MKYYNLFFIFLFFFAKKLTALPIGFGLNQGELEYNERKTQNFLLYHDKRTPEEAKMILHSLEKAKPVVEKWLGVSQGKVLPIISSAASANASFANMITDAIELQTLGLGSRDLFWHEYSHIIMYRHLHNFLGPAGSLLHLPWMPAWFLEGLAETFSVSIGSEQQASVERHHALLKDWPSFARLHSLYGTGGYFLPGYALSGAFLHWVLQKGKDDQVLFDILSDFYSYTWPWYYPLALIPAPIYDFMPMDKALQNHIGKKGEDLYKDYKNFAEEYWLAQRQGPFFSEQEGKRVKGQIGRLYIENDRVFYYKTKDSYLQKRELFFDQKTGWAIDRAWLDEFLPQQSSLTKTIALDDGVIGVTYQKDVKSALITNQISWSQKNAHSPKPQVKKTIYSSKGNITDLIDSANRIYFMEQITEETKLCYLEKSQIEHANPEAKCLISMRLPEEISYLGESIQHNHLWLTHRTQGLYGDRISLKKILLNDGKIQDIKNPWGGTPLKLIEHDSSSAWLLMASEKKRFLRRIDASGMCIEERNFEDFVTDFYQFDRHSLIFKIYAIKEYRGVRSSVIKVPINQLTSRTCRKVGEHVSPLLWALNHPENSNLLTALKEGDWHQIKEGSEETKITHSFPLDEKYQVDTVSQEANWRPRPVFAVPMIGSDIYSEQYGIISVPLMDHLQNETLTASILLGRKSLYPDIDLTLLSTRYWPTLSASFSKSQKWDGVSSKLESIYVDETAGTLSSAWNFSFFRKQLNLETRLYIADRKPYKGTTLVGALYMPGISVSYKQNINDQFFYKLITGISVAPALINPVFDYYKLSSSASANYVFPSQDASASLTAAFSTTQGTTGHIPHLKETYRPLKTYVTGAGGSLNATSFPLIGEGKLFNGAFGDSRMQLEASCSYPILRDIDRLFFFFYLESLELNAFLNYGGAFDQKAFSLSNLHAAHGYSLNLFIDNKGVRFNSGLGVGQVFGSGVQAYASFGFNALF